MTLNDGTPWNSTLSRTVCALAMIFGVASTAAGPGRAASPVEVPPNVMLIVLDTTRGDRVSFAGADRETTPHLAALARDGVVYSNAHSVAPWTLPSHGSMFTGRLPGEHGANWRAFASPPDATFKDLLSQTFRFEDSDRLIAERLRNRGYHTAGFSSNAWISSRTGFDHGFDHYYEMWKEDNQYRTKFQWIPPKFRSSGYLPTEIAILSEFDEGDGGKSVRTFEAHVAEHGLEPPFFVFLNLIDPHFPYSPPPSWHYAFGNDHELGEQLRRFEFDGLAMGAGKHPVDLARFVPFYDAELLYVDSVVGRLLASLRNRGLYDDTLIVVVSDHGELLGERGLFGHQYSVSEELLQIPLLIKYPGQEHAGETVDDPRVSNLDVYGTILDAAGERIDSDRPTRSQSLRDMERFDRTHLISEYYHSAPFLRMSREMHDAFDVDANSVDRRVLFDRDTRYEFVQRPGGELEPTDANAAQAAPEAWRAARDELEQYLDGLTHGGLAPAGNVDGPETLERLKSLGYVDD